jgi:glyoxylase-like metal-dependent hydrolase (beta-lactamase superfamily II)
MALRRRELLAGVLTAAAVPARADAPLSVGRFTSPRRSYATNSYWLEGRDGLVLIDTQFLPSEALQFVELAERSTGKKARTAVVLHPNPDKFNGTATLQARGVRVISSHPVVELIEPIHRIRLDWYYDDFKPDYPKELPRPEVFGESTRPLHESNLDLTLHVLGPGCSGAHVVVQAGDALFVGDLLTSRGHAWLEFALFDDWLRRLDELEAMKPKRIYVGGGEPGGPELIGEQRDYLRTVRSIVLAAKPSGEIGWYTRWRLKSQIVSAYPTYDWDGFVWESLPAIWRQLQNR